MNKILLLLSMVIVLTACNSVDPANKFDDNVYLQAESVPPIIIPEELKNKTYIDPFYPAPEGEYPEEEREPMSLLPPNMGKLIADEDPAEIKEIHEELE